MPEVRLPRVSDDFIAEAIEDGSQREALCAVAARDARAEVERLRAERRSLVERAVREGWCKAGLLDAAADGTVKPGLDAQLVRIADRILAEGGGA
jgi:hypothetical protein